MPLLDLGELEAIGREVDAGKTSDASSKYSIVARANGDEAEEWRLAEWHMSRIDAAERTHFGHLAALEAKEARLEAEKAELTRELDEELARVRIAKTEAEEKLPGRLAWDARRLVEWIGGSDVVRRSKRSTFRLGSLSLVVKRYKEREKKQVTDAAAAMLTFPELVHMVPKLDQAEVKKRCVPAERAFEVPVLCDALREAYVNAAPTVPEQALVSCVTVTESGLVDRDSGEVMVSREDHPEAFQLMPAGTLIDKETGVIVFGVSMETVPARVGITLQGDKGRLIDVSASSQAKMVSEEDEDAEEGEADDQAEGSDEEADAESSE